MDKQGEEDSVNPYFRVDTKTFSICIYLVDIPKLFGKYGFTSVYNLFFFPKVFSPLSLLVHPFCK